MTFCEKPQILVNPRDYDFSSDRRLLIPFVENQKWGLLNRDGHVVVKPEYDSILGECCCTNDVIIICQRFIKFYESRKKNCAYIEEHFGLVNSDGNIIWQRCLKVPEYRTDSSKTIR